MTFEFNCALIYTDDRKKSIVVYNEDKSVIISHVLVPDDIKQLVEYEFRHRTFKVVVNKRGQLTVLLIG